MLSLIVVAHLLAMQKMVTRSNSKLYLEGLSKFFLFLLKLLLGFLQFMCREATLAQLTLKVTHFLCWENRRTVLSQIVVTITFQHCVQVKNYFIVYFNCIATIEALHHNFC